MHQNTLMISGWSKSLEHSIRSKYRTSRRRLRLTGSAKRLNRKGCTSSSDSGPPKFKRRTPTLSPSLGLFEEATFVNNGDCAFSGLSPAVLSSIEMSRDTCGKTSEDETLECIFCRGTGDRFKKDEGSRVGNDSFTSWYSACGCLKLFVFWGSEDQWSVSEMLVLHALWVAEAASKSIPQLSTKYLCNHRREVEGRSHQVQS